LGGVSRQDVFNPLPFPISRRVDDCLQRIEKNREILQHGEHLIANKWLKSWEQMFQLNLPKEQDKKQAFI
jgi:hypothetical protein